ncbi:MAG: DUF455 family protein [Proteobacteria bacterium]|nr:DUF455 family protein [Pseudomonadota bacterium]
MTLTRPKIELFAERLLYSTNLKDKLTDSSSTAFESVKKATPFLTPDLPGRPPGLSLDHRPKTKSNYKFPKSSSLDHAESRGQVLHFFANHELLAIELMALALLKFPDSPESFQLGIVNTIEEEQIHMQLYIQRMKELGVEFGEMPLNGFFWNSLKTMSTPEEFVAGMSLTFEQANLDFSLQYKNKFSELGDHVTADVLQKVLIDEIGHVKHGVIWMNRWKAPNQSLWKAYMEHLHFPLTPMRGKAAFFDINSRKQAGLDDEFIRQMQIFSASKGRPPRVFWFNPTCEQEISSPNGSYNPPRQMADLCDDFSSLMMFLAKSDDIVLVKKKPGTEFLTMLQKCGFELPEFLESFNDPENGLKGRKLAAPQPWGWSPSSVRALSPLYPSIVKSEPTTPDQLWSEKESKKNIFGKLFSHSMYGSLAQDSYQVSTLDELNKVLLNFPIGTKIVVKAIFGSSGRNFLHLISGQSLEVNQTKWIENELAKTSFLEKKLIIEPWRERIADLSYQGVVLPSGEIEILDVTRFIVNPRGQYLGHYLGKTLEGLPSDVPRLWHHSENSWESAFQKWTVKAGHALAEQGYHGPFGIDGYIYRSLDQFHFHPLSEINPRFTMGRVALELKKKLPRNSPALWLHVSLPQIKKLGISDFSQLDLLLREKYPASIKFLNSGEAQFTSGYLPTNDPNQAKSYLSLIISDHACADWLVDENPMKIELALQN